MQCTAGTAELRRSGQAGAQQAAPLPSIADGGDAGQVLQRLKPRVFWLDCVVAEATTYKDSRVPTRSQRKKSRRDAGATKTAYRPILGRVSSRRVYRCCGRRWRPGVRWFADR